MSKKALVIWISLFFGAAAAVGIYLHTQIQKGLEKKSHPETGSAHIGGYFSLRDLRGNLVTPEKFRGRYMLIYFGYSFCPDICPMGLDNMSDAIELLGEHAKKVQPIFITVDPGRDTQPQLDLYMRGFHNSFLALTGSQSDVTRAMKAYKVYAARVNDEGMGDYLIDHSSIVYFMGPNGKFITHFTHKTPGHAIALKIREIIKEGNN